MNNQTTQNTEQLEHPISYYYVQGVSDKASKNFKIISLMAVFDVLVDNMAGALTNQMLTNMVDDCEPLFQQVLETQQSMNRFSDSFDAFQSLFHENIKKVDTSLMIYQDTSEVWMKVCSLIGKERFERFDYCFGNQFIEGDSRVTPATLTLQNDNLYCEFELKTTTESHPKNEIFRTLELQIMECKFGIKQGEDIHWADKAQTDIIQENLSPLMGFLLKSLSSEMILDIRSDFFEAGSKKDAPEIYQVLGNKS